MVKRLIYLILVLLILPNILLASTLSKTNTSINKKASANNLTKILNNYNFKVVGQATLSVLFWDIYKSTLLTTSGIYPINSNDEKILYKINYLKNISSNELIKHTKEQWQHLDVPINTYQPFITSLKSIWPDVTKGDTLSLLIHNQQSSFYFNEHYIGSINSPEFGQLFIDIWLANNTSQPTLRAQLLGGKSND